MGGDGVFRRYSSRCSVWLYVDTVQSGCSDCEPRRYLPSFLTATHEGRVVQPCPQGLLCSPSPLQPCTGPSSLSHKLLAVSSPLLCSPPPLYVPLFFFSTTPFIFQRKKIFIWILVLCLSIFLPLHLLFYFQKHKDGILSPLFLLCVQF